MLRNLLTKLRNSENRANALLRIATKYINPWLRKLGMTLIVHHFYQPIPDDRNIALYQKKKRPLDAIDWRFDLQKEFTKKLLAEYSTEFNDPQIMQEFGYSAADGTFGSGSKEFYYAMIRRLKPRHIIEIGAGNSSLICLSALKRNYLETDVKAEFITIEPFPSDKIKQAAVTGWDFVDFTLIPEKLQRVDGSLFQMLEVNDILFVDSSHVFKQGSDVEYEFLNIYPNLKAGVYVHIHDIFTPYDYPAAWNNKHFHFWNEQYFLEILLMNSSRYQVVAGLAMLHFTDHSVFSKHIRDYKSNQNSGSFWMTVRN